MLLAGIGLHSRYFRVPLGAVRIIIFNLASCIFFFFLNLFLFVFIGIRDFNFI